MLLEVEYILDVMGFSPLCQNDLWVTCLTMHSMRQGESGMKGEEWPLKLLRAVKEAILVFH